MQHARLVTVLAALVASAVPARADEREVVLFRPATGGFVLDDPRLADAIRIHTRDVTPGEPGTGNRLTVWYEGTRERSGQVTVALYVLPPGQPLVMVRVRGRLDANLYRALALKVRAALVGDPSLTRVEAPPEGMVPAPSTPSPSGSESVTPAPGGTRPGSTARSPSPATVRTPSAPSTPAPARASPIAAGPASPATARPPATATPTATAAGAPTARLAVAAGAHTEAPSVSWSAAYRALKSTRPLALTVEGALRVAGSEAGSQVRAGAVAAVALAVGPLYEVTVGLAYDPTYSGSSASGHMNVWAIPIVTSLRLLYRGDRWTFGLGPRLGVTIVHGTLTNDQGQLLDTPQTRAAALLGGETLLRYRAYSKLHAFVQASLDVNLPNLRMRAGPRGDTPSPVFDVGQLAWAGILGVAYTIP